jgi:outer membrane protein assembly factor BamD
MAAHVEDARDRLIAMNRPVPEPSQQAIAESEAEEQSRQPVRFTDKTLGMIKHGPTVVEASHVGDPTMEAPKRTLAPEISKEEREIFAAAFKGTQPGAATTEATKTPTGVNEPPRSDQPQAPLKFEDVPAGAGTGNNSIGASVVSAPNSAPAEQGQPAAQDPNAVIKAVGSTNTTLPAAEAPAEAPAQINSIKPGSQPAQSATPAVADGKTKKAKKPALDQSEESSSKKKKKKGVSKLNPF